MLQQLTSTAASAREATIGKTGVLGAFEELVLLALIRQADEAYAVSIRRDLVKRTGTDVAMGAVYATLDRLEEKGMIRPSERAPDEKRRGRPRRYYEICEPGVDALSRTHTVRERMWKGIDLAHTGPGGEGV